MDLEFFKDERRTESELNNRLYSNLRDLETIERRLRAARISDEEYQLRSDAIEADTEKVFAGLVKLLRREKDRKFLMLSELESKLEKKAINEKKYTQKSERISRDVVLLDYEISSLNSSTGRAAYMDELIKRHYSVSDMLNYMLVGLLFSVPFYTALILLQDPKLLEFSARLSVEYPVLYFTILALEALFLFFITKSIIIEGYTKSNIVGLLVIVAAIYLLVGNPMQFRQERLSTGSDFLLLKRSVKNFVAQEGVKTAVGFNVVVPILKQTHLSPDGTMTTLITKPPATIDLKSIYLENTLTGEPCKGPIRVNENQFSEFRGSRISSQVQSFLLTVKGCDIQGNPDAGDLVSMELGIKYELDLGGTKALRVSSGKINGL
ncbi:MAG: hypothetical protein ABH950_01375 [Candidatus Altiarchaeota archaeon]